MYSLETFYEFDKVFHSGAYQQDHALFSKIVAAQLQGIRNFNATYTEFKELIEIGVYPLTIDLGYRGTVTALSEEAQV